MTDNTSDLRRCWVYFFRSLARNVRSGAQVADCLATTQPNEVPRFFYLTIALFHNGSGYVLCAAHRAPRGLLSQLTTSLKLQEKEIAL